jgi:hypothetical protein
VRYGFRMLFYVKTYAICWLKSMHSCQSTVHKMLVVIQEGSSREKFHGSGMELDSENWSWETLIQEIINGTQFMSAQSGRKRLIFYIQILLQSHSQLPPAFAPVSVMSCLTFCLLALPARFSKRLCPGINDFQWSIVKKCLFRQLLVIVGPLTTTRLGSVESARVIVAPVDVLPFSSWKWLSRNPRTEAWMMH